MKYYAALKKNEELCELTSVSSRLLSEKSNKSFCNVLLFR